MNTNQRVESSIFEQFERNDEFAGFGYIGSRRNMLTESDPDVAPIAERRAMVEQADATILRFVAAHGWTEQELFTWANSKDGRWFADTAFGGYGIESAMKLLVKQDA